MFGNPLRLYQDYLEITHRAIRGCKLTYQKALESGNYDLVLRFDGLYVPHPALTNAKEYFAEMTEAYYGFNDHYPFIQFELKQHDPEICELLAKLWQGGAR